MKHEHIYQKRHQVVVHVQDEVIVNDEHSTIVLVINERHDVDSVNIVKDEQNHLEIAKLQINDIMQIHQLNRNNVQIINQQILSTQVTE